MARTHRRLSQASSKRKLIMLSPRRIRLQTSEELAREERNESWDDRIQAEQHQARSLS